MVVEPGPLPITESILEEEEDGKADERKKGEVVFGVGGLEHGLWFASGFAHLVRGEGRGGNSPGGDSGYGNEDPSTRKRFAGFRDCGEPFGD